MAGCHPIAEAQLPLLLLVCACACVFVCCQTYEIDADAAERPVEEYNMLQEFFTRRLKPGLRPITAEG